MSLGKRLFKFINYLGLNRNQFGFSIGLSNAENIRNLTNGKTKDPKSSLIIGILNNYTELNARWLLTGKGDMINKYSSPHQPDNTKQIVSEPIESYDSLCIKCSNYESEINRLICDKDQLLDRLEKQSELIGKLKEKLD